MIERFAAGAVSVAAVTAVGAASSDPTFALIAEWMPTVTGIICAVIVWCITVMNSNKKKTWSYNTLVGILTSIFTAVVVREYALTPLYAMMVGMTAGAMGVGIISLGKPFLLAILSKSMEALKETNNDKLENGSDPPQSNP